MGSLGSLSSMWEVLMLFLIPVGSGIPGGVLLARSRGIVWPVMMVLYLISDVILASVFEPLMLLVIAAGKRSAFLTRLREAFGKYMKKTTSFYGSSLGPFALIMVSFGADPMTGRVAAAASGHGFVVGWILAILGDMLYFTLLMVSTLWLSNILGNGTWATVIILLLTMVVPPLVRRFHQSIKALLAVS